MKIDVINANHLTEPLVSAWSKIQSASFAYSNPSFCPEFTQAIAKVRDDVEVGVMVSNDQPVGFFPFQRSPNNAALPVGSVLTDMHGFIVADDIPWSADWLLRECGLVAWEFDHLVASQHQFEPYFKCVEDSPYMDLSHGYDEYIKERKRASASTIKRARAKSRKIEREVGPLRFTLHDSNPEMFSQIIQWKRQQLAEMNYVDMYKSEWVINALQEICTVQTHNFSGIISTLHAGDQLVAAMIGMQTPQVISSWIPTYNTAFSKYSPGMLLHLEQAKFAADLGIQRIDLGRGLNQMKTSLGSASIPVALGAIDCRPLNRLIRHCWYKARNLIHESPLNEFSLRYYRRARRWLT
ncbi:MAG: hypothetical protein COA78_03125 [Blastopirellula sp.]|nr:MAG: hypothetical protein COA78_03125 [Blastopirellula sp.]